MWQNMWMNTTEKWDLWAGMLLQKAMFVFVSTFHFVLFTCEWFFFSFSCCCRRLCWRRGTEAFSVNCLFVFFPFWNRSEKNQHTPNNYTLCMCVDVSGWRKENNTTNNDLPLICSKYSVDSFCFVPFLL